MAHRWECRGFYDLGGPPPPVTRHEASQPGRARATRQRPAVCHRHVESGHQTTVPLDIAQRLAEALAVTLDSLVGSGEASRTPDPGGRGPEA